MNLFFLFTINKNMNNVNSGNKSLMELRNSSDKKRVVIGIAMGAVFLLLAAGTTALAFLMVSVMVFGCRESPPEWVFMFVFIGFPIPLIISSIVTSYLYIKKQRTSWIILSLVGGVFMSCGIFFVWFLILTRYC